MKLLVAALGVVLVILSPAMAAGGEASANPRPLVIHNPDGTFTIQKEPPEDMTAGANGKTEAKGLVIHPQVVIPLVPVRGRCQEPCKVPPPGTPAPPQVR